MNAGQHYYEMYIMTYYHSDFSVNIYGVNDKVEILNIQVWSLILKYAFAELVSIYSLDVHTDSSV